MKKWIVTGWICLGLFVVFSAYAAVRDRRAVLAKLDSPVTLVWPSGLVGVTVSTSVLRVETDYGIVCAVLPPRRTP